jgi:hypothetical protein
MMEGVFATQFGREMTVRELSQHGPARKIERRPKEDRRNVWQAPRLRRKLQGAGLTPRFGRIIAA